MAFCFNFKMKMKKKSRFAECRSFAQDLVHALSFVLDLITWPFARLKMWMEDKSVRCFRCSPLPRARTHNLKKGVFSIMHRKLNKLINGNEPIRENEPMGKRISHIMVGLLKIQRIQGNESKIVSFERQPRDSKQQSVDDIRFVARV